MNVRRGDVVLVLYPFASCNNLATVHEDRIHRVIGHLPDAMMHRIDECLKAALGLP